MSLLEAILIGIIQGATEFLPISSDGHLVLIPSLFRFTAPDLVLIGLVHAGTLVAILTYFFRDVWTIFKAVVAGLVERRPLADPTARLGWYMVVGSIPAAIVGLAFTEFFEETFTSPVIAAVGLLITGAFLVVGERLLSGRKTIESVTWLDTVIVGIFQVFALFPGISRSGTTISGGLWRGLDRPTAARFSFLIGIPAIFGAGMLSIIDIFTADERAFTVGVYVAAFLAAAITGYLCIHFLLTWVRRHSLYIFAVYCFTFGGLYLLYRLATSGILSATLQ